jgi:hypothetical protein
MATSSTTQVLEVILTLKPIAGRTGTLFMLQESDEQQPSPKLPSVAS